MQCEVLGHGRKPFILEQSRELFAELKPAQRLGDEEKSVTRGVSTPD